MSSSEAWAQLVSTTDTISEPIVITKHKFSIGRSKVADLCLMGNKLVSGNHCFIEKENCGKVWIQDASTNGTLLNQTKKITHSKVELNHGDEIHLVFRGDDTSLNVAYVFQDLEKLRVEEEEATLEYSSDVNTSQTIEDVEEERLNLEGNLHGKRKTEESRDDSDDVIEKPPLKRLRSGSKNTECVVSGDAGEATFSKNTEHKGESSGAKEEKDEKKPQDLNKKDAIEETLICMICQEIMHNCISLQPCMHSFCAGCYSEWMEQSDTCPSCRLKVDRINKNYIVNNLVEAYLLQHPEKKRPEEELKELDAKNKITRDMLHPWKRHRNDDDDDEYDSELDDSSDVDDGGFVLPVSTGPIFTQPIRPSRTVCRQCPTSGSTLAAMATSLGQAVHVVSNTMVRIVDRVTGSDRTTPASTTAPSAAQGPTKSVGSTPSQGDDQSTSSSQQPSTSNPTDTGGATCTATSSADDDKKVMPTAPDYVCSSNQNHMLCQCCLQPMPDRRSDRICDIRIPPQQCELCYRGFCHQYWGCTKADCLGCLAKFKDHNFGKKCLASLILDNLYESDILANYMRINNISVKDVLRECIQKLQTGEYNCTDQQRLQSGNAVTCYACGLRNFKELAYQYRESVPRTQLPAAVTARSNCYWGRNCRTQRTKPHHSARFNHICDQTRGVP